MGYNKLMNSGFAELPILKFKNDILAAVDSSQVTIITAETGAGKSTQVPQYLAEHGYSKVIVTQPRILAARNLSKRVREEWALRNSEDSSEIVGYRTAHERDDSVNNKILYCTDGLQMVRELVGAGTDKGQVLVLDEVHEWNENMEVLLAWAKKRAEHEPRFKIVIMSATIDTEPLSEYFATDSVINVPGRSFAVKKSRGTDVVSEIMGQLENPGANMLVFLPGKAEIEAVKEIVEPKAKAAGVPVLPLHSQLTLEEQQLAFNNYASGKVILSTNIAQTSVTIDDIDMVIDSGLERRSEVRSGVEGLFIAQVSQADCLQRAGRAGRTKPGEYILAPLDNMPCDELERRPEYGVPEILRSLIDRLTLRLASIGIDIEELDFYHDPSRGAIKRAKATLRALGALTNDGRVTEIGRKMERFPVESSFGRMLVAAEDLPKSTQFKLAAIIAIQEVGGIIKGGTRYTGWRQLTQQKRSDLIAQYDVWLNLEALTTEELEDIGIISKNIHKAEEVMGRLSRDLGLESEQHGAVDKDEETAICRVITAGQVHQLWVRGDQGQATHLFTGAERELSNSTVVNHADMVVGTPFDLQIPTQKGALETLHLVQGLTRVEPSWLKEFAGVIVSVKQGGLRFDPRSGQLIKTATIRMKGKKVEIGAEPVLESTPKNRKALATSLAEYIRFKLESKRDFLQRGYHRKLPLPSVAWLKGQISQIFDGAMSLEQLDSRQARQLNELLNYETYVGEKTLNKLESLAAKNRQRGHSHKPQRRHGFKRKNKNQRRRDW